jgi:hypothetical protein
MSTFFERSSHMPCSECGGSVPERERDGHVCDPERLLDFQMIQLREEIASFEDDFGTYLETSQGRLAQWYAEYRRPPV